MARRRTIRLLMAGLLAVAAQSAAAQQEREVDVRGRVRVADAGMAQARVQIGEYPAVQTAADGRFVVRRVPAGSHQLKIAAIGYKVVTRQLTLPADSLLEDVRLTPATARVSDLVVTGTLAEVRVDESPVKVEVISRRALERNLTTNLMESVRAIPGLREQVDCGVCYTNSISINGMDGPYTAVLFDGVPVLGALATVYALNSLNPALLEQVEIVKGPASTLYGSEAMAGVVNIISRDPRTAPAWSVNASATSHGQLSADALVRPLVAGGRLFAAATGAWNDRFVDGNHDGFSDVPLTTRASALVKWSDGNLATRRADILARYWYEDRFGGVRAWTPAHRGSNQVYGESIMTNRWEVIAGLRPNVLGDALRISAAVSGHKQDSFYGATHYLASQRTMFLQATWAPTVSSGGVRPLLGATWRRQWYDDDTPATLTAEDRIVPGVFGELELPLGRHLTMLGGTRLDRHAAHGGIVSPRAALRWAPSEATTLRLNAATGFRVVHLFTEDHAALSGSRQVVIEETLEPERSATVTASLRTTTGTTTPVVFDADVFFTRFRNRIIPDYNVDPELIVYRNLDGAARTAGVSLGVSIDPTVSSLAFRAGATYQRVTRTVNDVVSDVEFAPRVKADFGVTWEGPSGIDLDWTGTVTGRMALPILHGVTEYSPWFTEQHVQLTRAIGPNRFVTVGLKNIFNTRQRDPLVAPDDPFGPNFDTYRVWGPVQGRRLVVAVQWNAPN